MTRSVSIASTLNKIPDEYFHIPLSAAGEFPVVIRCNLTNKTHFQRFFSITEINMKIKKDPRRTQ